MSSVRRQLFPVSSNSANTSAPSIHRFYIKRRTELWTIFVVAVFVIVQINRIPVDDYEILTADRTTHAVSDDMKEASLGRERLVKILQEAGINNMTVSDISTLPKWKQIEDLYGSKPVILGLEKCAEFRKKVPSSQRYIGTAGNFNSGTTAFGISLADNCRFPDHVQNISNDVVQDVNGMLSQVPWAKHKAAYRRNNHTIEERIIKDHVLPVVLARDPYRWMASMCVQGYGVRWSHDPKHCPNLVPTDYDRRRFKNLQNKKSVPVHMGGGITFPSLVHYWNDWYYSYLTADFPRLIIRFEDTLFRSAEVMEQVCKCAGGETRPKFLYHVGEAKKHAHKQNNFISAMIKYGTAKDRFRNMTEEDLLYARNNLNPKLMSALRYTH